LIHPLSQFALEPSSSWLYSFVCAVEARHMNKTPTKFRDWLPIRDANYNCRIWQAARATSAAPQLFKRISIGEPLRQQHFVDGALGCNNPIIHLLCEATREFDGNKEVGCILSLGTGMHSAAGFQAHKGYQRMIPKDLIHAMARMVTDCSEVADQMAERFKNYHRLYHRFNVGYELGAIGLDEWSRLGEVEAHTRAYLRRREVSLQVDEVVEALLGRPSQVLLVESLCTSNPKLLPGGRAIDIAGQLLTMSVKGLLTHYTQCQPV
jgi:hypothetical protein